MKYLLLIPILLPVLVSGQVKMTDLITKRGLAWEMAGRAPYTGKAYTLYPTGDTQTVATYKDGIPDGEIVGWYSKGHKEIEGFLDKGQKAGIWHEYYPGGNLKKTITYDHDVENGPETTLFENGQKQSEGFYKNGAQDSTWNEWYENGKQKWVGHFSNFERNGDWAYWDEQGNVTVKKRYEHGLVIVAKDDLDSYVEKMQYYFERKNYKEALKNVEAAEATLPVKTDTTQAYMNLELFRSKCYSYPFHYRQGEKILLDAIGMTPAQSQIIQNSHLDKSPAKFNQIITEINQKEQTGGFKATNHIALAVCYNILGDSANFQQQQQIAMLKGGMKDYIVNMSMELYRLAGVRMDSYQALQTINGRIAKEGATERLELEKVQYLIGNEKFPEAQKIVDKYLQKDPNNVTVLLSKAALETANGNYDKTKQYEQKALAIDPNALGGGGDDTRE